MAYLQPGNSSGSRGDGWRSLDGHGIQSNCGREYDAQNPRTANRALPAGLLSVGFVWVFTAVSATLFFVAAAMLNRLTLVLAPVALASVLLYSFTKRWTLLSHLMLGWCLSIAPTGAWIAVRGALDSPVPLLLSLVVMLWTAGFDVLYACQDYDFDVKGGTPFDSQKFRNRAGAVDSARAPSGAFAALLGLYWMTQLGIFALIGVIATASCSFTSIGW